MVSSHRWVALSPRLKEASFTLGENLYVMTKQKGASQVLQKCNEKKEMRRKYDVNSAAAYESDTVRRGVGAPQVDGECKLQMDAGYASIVEMVRGEQTEASFTTIVITDVKKTFVDQFKETAKFAHDLGAYFHFFMLDQSQGGAALQSGRATRGSASTSRDNLLQIPRWLGVPEGEAPLSLRLQCLDAPLIEVGDTLHLTKQFMQASVNTKFCYMKHSECGKCTCRANCTCGIAFIMLQYFPSKNFIETHPQVHPTHTYIEEHPEEFADKDSPQQLPRGEYSTPVHRVSNRQKVDWVTICERAMYPRRRPGRVPMARAAASGGLSELFAVRESLEA